MLKVFDSGGTALSPSGRILAVMNLSDGIDWYSVENGTYIRSTTYVITEFFPVNVKFLGEEVVVAGNSQGGIVFASSFSGERPRFFSFGTLKKESKHLMFYMVFACAYKCWKGTQVLVCLHNIHLTIKFDPLITRPSGMTRATVVI